jgi:tRNA pseudouridine38-40 synthase
MRYFLHIGYDGSKYRGWQRQSNVISVQEVIEDKLKGVFKKEVTVYGCGRTDAGVHASQYFIHINLEAALTFDLKFIINKHLPDGIVVHDVIEVGDREHARFDATWRTYDYFIHLFEDPILFRYSSYYNLENLDIQAMKNAVKVLTQYKDFRAYCKRADLHNHTECDVKLAQIFSNEDGTRIRFSITANRFLRGMIRIIVDFLLQVGTGDITVEEFEKMLADKKDLEKKKPALPNGLYLSKVEYPFLNLDQRPDLTSLLKTDLK